MYKLNENSEKEQARVVYEKITREWDCITEEGVEFKIRISEDGNGSEYWTNIQEDGTVDRFYEPSFDSEIYTFIESVLEEGW